MEDLVKRFSCEHFFSGDIFTKILNSRQVELIVFPISTIANSLCEFFLETQYFKVSAINFKKSSWLILFGGLWRKKSIPWSSYLCLNLFLLIIFSTCSLTMFFFYLFGRTIYFLYFDCFRYINTWIASGVTNFNESTEYNDFYVLPNSCTVKVSQLILL